MRPQILAALLSFISLSLLAAEQGPIRVAVGPYFAPAQDAALQSAADAVPDLLTAELGGNARFHVVERAQVKAVVKELHLSAEGLTSTETVLKLGKLLSADWLISGAIAPSATSTQLWSKVIDMRSGVVLDLQGTPLTKDLMASIMEAGKFVAKAGRSNTAPRQFVALGPFRDYSMNAGKPDWSRQLQFMLEKDFRERGFGIVEREAIATIAQEIDLSAQGLTASSSNRVKMQPAFWLVDGGSQWTGTAGTNLSVTLWMQKVGSPETVLKFSNSSIPALEQAIRDGLSAALPATKAGPQVAKATDEGKVQAARGYELATARNPLADPNYLNTARGTPQESLARRQDNSQMAVQRYEAAYALNPNDLDAKHMLGIALAANPDTMERGKQLLWEIVKKNEPRSRQRALSAIAMAELSEQGPTPGSRMSFRPSDLEQQMILLTNSADLNAKFKLGTSLLGYRSERNQKCGVTYLEEVAKNTRGEMGASAERALVEYRRRPPEVRSASLQGKVFTATVAPRAPSNAEQPPVVIPEPEIPTEPEEPDQLARREFMQKNFNRFIPVKFEKDPPNLAHFYHLSVKENMFDHEGKHYCGFRFTVPAGIDGNFKWMHILAKTEAQKTFSASDFSWYIIRKTGRMKGFEDYSHIEVGRYKKLSERFPYTKKYYLQELPRNYLKPGEEYAIWFSFTEADLPDIEFAITIASHRGYTQFGILPMQ